jgi:antitoxin ParD1/3/4
MTATYTLDPQSDSFVQDQLARGRYRDATEIVRDALRLMEERERKLAIVDAAIDRGLDDMNAGRVSDARAVFDRLKAKYARAAQQAEANEG